MGRESRPPRARCKDFIRLCWRVPWRSSSSSRSTHAPRMNGGRHCTPPLRFCATVRPDRRHPRNCDCECKLRQSGKWSRGRRRRRCSTGSAGRTTSGWFGVAAPLHSISLSDSNGLILLKNHGCFAVRPRFQFSCRSRGVTAMMGSRHAPGSVHRPSARFSGHGNASVIRSLIRVHADARAWFRRPRP